MAEHCWEHGFIVRYQKDKEEITRITFEPWHLRYVGVQVACYMRDHHLCLEEFTEEWENARDAYRNATN
ncbi:MAG: D-alanyl-D-alanine carboxypeptidase family protein [Clostridia bacterium]|nr:D-alanyl-D-alanine carboxypeptidase family protein [Clostridia bacterium]